MKRIHLSCDDYDHYIAVHQIVHYYDREGNGGKIITYVELRNGRQIYIDQNAKQIDMRINEALKQ